MAYEGKTIVSTNNWYKSVLDKSISAKEFCLKNSLSRNVYIFNWMQLFRVKVQLKVTFFNDRHIYFVK